MGLRMMMTITWSIPPTTFTSISVWFNTFTRGQDMSLIAVNIIHGEKKEEKTMVRKVRRMKREEESDGEKMRMKKKKWGFEKVMSGKWKVIHNKLSKAIKGCNPNGVMTRNNCNQSIQRERKKSERMREKWEEREVIQMCSTSIATQSSIRNWYLLISIDTFPIKKGKKIIGEP